MDLAEAYRFKEVKFTVDVIDAVFPNPFVSVFGCNGLVVSMLLPVIAREFMGAL